MLNPHEPATSGRQALSSTADGEASDRELGEACALWRQDAEARCSWHVYHLIGDVLRSDDLAGPPARDEAFLQALRGRLALEPVPLAPAALGDPVALADDPAVAPRGLPGVRRPRARLRRWWMAPAAVAAGFVAVAGVMVVTQIGVPAPAAAPGLAQAPVGPQSVPVAPTTLVRDAQLDRYLAAHRSQAYGAAPAGGAEHRVHIVYEGR